MADVIYHTLVQTIKGSARLKHNIQCARYITKLTHFHIKIYSTEQQERRETAVTMWAFCVSN